MRQLAIYNELYVKFCQLAFHIGTDHELVADLGPDGMFDHSFEVFVSRAPGRMDVIELQ